MRLLAVGLVSLACASSTGADVASELQRMLASHPDADANADGALTQEEAANYIFHTRRGGRMNRGSGIRNRSLIDAYEARTHESMPYRLLKPIHIESGKRYPLIVSLHGSGGVGDDNLSNLRFWNGVMAQQQWRQKYPCFVLVPQRRPGGIWGPKPDVPGTEDLFVRDDLNQAFEIIESLQQEFPIDSDRIYALGSSGGGAGTWNIVVARPDMFAAAIPVCARFNPAHASRLAHLPIWVFHGDADQLISVEHSRSAFAALREAGGNIKYTELRGVRHSSWIQAFTYVGDDESKGYLTQLGSEKSDPTADVWEWLFARRKQ
ncbi:MAG: prolyl oligopeptidase family serine peptidase [Bryobacterales bacterium]|nr:prolyl oligopeptidase family serine peptidase [Bryobacterales bacterium]